MTPYIIPGIIHRWWNRAVKCSQIPKYNSMKFSKLRDLDLIFELGRHLRMSPWERMGCALTDIGTFWTNHSERGQSRFLSQSVMAKSGNRTAHSPSPSHIMTHYAKTTNSLGAYSNRTYRTSGTYNSISNMNFFLWNIGQRNFVRIKLTWVTSLFKIFVIFQKFWVCKKAFEVAKINLFDIILLKILYFWDRINFESKFYKLEQPYFSPFGWRRFILWTNERVRLIGRGILIYRIRLSRCIRTFASSHEIIPILHKTYTTKMRVSVLSTQAAASNYHFWIWPSLPFSRPAHHFGPGHWSERGST